MSLSTLAEAGVTTITLDKANPGDAVFCHSRNLFGKAIRLGQFLKRFPKQFRKWNHIGWLDEPIYNEAGDVVDWYVGQAIAKGVSTQYKLSDISPGGEHEIVPLEAFPCITDTFPINRVLVVETLREQVGIKYGFLTILSEVINILTPKFVRIDIRRDNTWICSALYSYALLAGGGKVVGDVYQVMPAEVAAVAK